MSEAIKPTSALVSAAHRQEAEALAKVLRSRGRSNSKFDINRAANLLDLLAAAPAAPQAAGVGDYTMALAEPQAFETFPALAAHIERMAAGHGVGSLIEWNAFLRDLNASLRAPSREPEGGAISRDQLFAIVRQFVSPLWCSVDRLADTLFSALATREEAPAEAGELAQAIKHLTEMSELETVYGQLSRNLRVVLSALRAQPQAREDAQPVAWTDSKSLSRIVAWGGGFRGCIYGISSPAHSIALYTHPAPDALRVAVEALEEIADTDPDNGTSWFHERANQALAALQAEQGAK